MCGSPWKEASASTTNSTWEQTVYVIKEENWTQYWALGDTEVFLSFFLYVLTSVKDIKRGSVYKCKGGGGGGGG